MPTKKVKKTIKKKVVAKKAVAKKVVKKVAVKKAVKKVTVKKVATKKKVVAKRKVSTKKCACVKSCRPEEAFWINNGPIIESLADLKMAVNSMTEKQFAFHTKRNGNDFAKWIRDCLSDTARATLVEKAKTRTGTVRALTSGCCK